MNATPPPLRRGVELTNDQHNTAEHLMFKVVGRNEVVIEWWDSQPDYEGKDEAYRAAWISFEPQTIRQMAEFLAEFSFCPECGAPIHRSEAEHTCAEPAQTDSFIDEGEIPF